jgi:ribose transport system substrate-binding protein
MRDKLHNSPVRRHGFVLLAGILAIASLSGCAADKKSSALSSEDASACVEAAKANLETAMAPMKLPEIETLDTSSFAGKKFAVVQLSGKSEVTTGNGNGFEKAMESVGAEVIKFDGKGTPDLIAQGFQSAIGQQVDGIVTDGFDPTMVKSAVADAKAAGIPVVSAHTAGPDEPLLDGVLANIAVDSSRVGTLQADYALADTDCQLQTATFFTTAGPVTVHMADSAEAQIKKLCGSDCSIEKIDVNPATYATSMTGQVQTTVQRSPDMNYIISTVDFWVPYVNQGLKAVGKVLPILGGAQGDGIAAAIEGNGVVAEFLWPPAEVTGWFYADTIMRAVSGKPTNRELPLQVADESTWGSTTDFDALYPDLVGYEDTFKKAWGAS